MKAKFKAGNLRQAKKGWKETIIDRIHTGKVLPIISGAVSEELLFGSQETIHNNWAEYVEFPADNTAQFTQVTQYTSVMLKADPEVKADDVYIKEAYLEFLKGTLWEQADEELQEELEEDAELESLTFTQFAQRLEMPAFDEDNKDALLYLAALPLPIYVTTSYHGFLEAALRRAGREPRVEICYWNNTLESIPSVFDDTSYTPTPQEPLIFHMHGLDKYTQSMVMTEDDYLDFLVGISVDWEGVPLSVRQALTDSSLLLLGYGLRNWDFRVLFRGLIKTSIDQRRPKSVSIQLPDNDVEKTFLKNYLSLEADLEVYWGNATDLMAEIYQGWANQA